MRSGLIVAGLLIAALGAAAALGMLEFTQRKEVLKIGDFSAKVDRERTVPVWVGGIGIVVGLGLIAVGISRK